MIYADVERAAPAVAACLAAAQRIVILTHVNPDGDAIGALLGTWHALRALGKEALPLATPPLPAYTRWLPGIDQTRIYQPGTPLPPADLVVMVDTASLARVGAIYDDHAATLAALPLLIIDHHVTNDGGGALNLVDPTAASTCDLLYRLFVALDVPITPDLATCLLLGLTTDTQSFQTSATRPASLRAAAALHELGADHHRIVHEVYYQLPASTAALIGHTLAGLRWEAGVAWATVTRAMMDTTGAEEESADEVVRVMQRIGEAQVLVLLKERADGTTKISLRSRPPINVAEFARRWGGGGHAQAAGATLLLTPEQAAAEVVPALQALVRAT